MSLAVHRGVRFLRKYLRKHAFDFHRLDLTAFKEWLERQIRTKQRDASFLQRVQIRDLRRQYNDQLTTLTNALQEAAKQWDDCPQRQRIETLEREIDGRHKAISGLAKAMQNRSGEKRVAAEEKLRSFQDLLAEQQRELQHLLATTPAKIAYDDAQTQLASFHNEIGLTQLEEQLQQIFIAQGHRTVRAGSRFEETANHVLQTYIMPQLRGRGCEGQRLFTKDIQLLSQVKLGCARAELDYVVVYCPPSSPDPVTVLGIVEVKRNINDVASGFTMRQENLHWFTRRKKYYDTELYRTKVFRQGHFDCPAYHDEKEQRYLFTPQSFRLFIPEDLRQYPASGGYFLERLSFITTDRHRLIGMSAAEHSKIIYRIATDLRFSLDDQDYLCELQQWAKGVVNEWQTYDVMQLYAAERERGQQFFVQELQRG